MTGWRRPQTGHPQHQATLSRSPLPVRSSGGSAFGIWVRFRTAASASMLPCCASDRPDSRFGGPSRNDGSNHIPVTAMFDTAIFSRIRSAAGHFARADQGNIAVLFGIAAVPILTFVGVAIDYTRATAARTAMQTALDSAALM